MDADEAVAAVQQAPARPRIPVAVISKTEPFATSPTVPLALHKQLEEVWPEVQNRLVNLGYETPCVIATDSDHYVQIHDPDLVVSMIRLVVERAWVALDRRWGSLPRPDLAGEVP